MFEWLLGIITKFLVAGGLNPPHVVASILGAIVAALLDDNVTFFQGVVAAFVGTLCSIYFAPVVAIVIGVSGGSMMNAVAFFAGLVGFQATKGIIKQAKLYAKRPGAFKEVAREFILRLITKK